jgi:hypothetical protein
MATAEYLVGTLGTVLLATVLFRLVLEDSWWVDQLRRIIERALRPGLLLEHLRNIPRLGLR